ASLAYGGRVVDEGIQCPFHGWVWSPEGRNMCIPYQERPNTARRIRPWEVVECNESVYLWHDESGRPPLWQPPRLADLGAHVEHGEFHPAQPRGRAHFLELTVHPQQVVEN